MQIPSKYRQYIPDLKQEKTQKFTTLALTFLALSFFGIFAINPTISTIVRLRKEISDSQFTEAQLKQKILNLSSLSSQYTQIQQDLPVILSGVPQSPQIPLLAAQIQSLARDSNIKLDSLQTFQVEAAQPSSVGKKYSSFSFSLSSEGSYNQLVNFMQSLISMQRVVSIDTIALNKKQDQSGIIQLSLKGTAFFKK